MHMCISLLMLPVSPNWTLADARGRFTPAQRSQAKPRPQGRAGFQSLVYGAGDAGPRDPVEDLKRRELEKRLLNHLREAHFAVTSLPAVDDDRLPLHPPLWIVSEFGRSHSVTELTTASSTCLPSCSRDRFNMVTPVNLK